MNDNLIETGNYDFKDVPGSENWIRLCEIDEGDSSDRKYYVKTRTSDRYFLRIADSRLYDRKKNEYEHLKAARDLGAEVPSPVGFGFCGGGQLLYLQTHWIYGRVGSVQLPKLDPCQQYELGTSAGLFLKMVHCCPIPPRRPSGWQECQVRRWRTAIGLCREKMIKIPGEAKLSNLIEHSLPLLADRPQRLLHGAFHTGNIILSFEDSLSLIDFDQWQYGDPLFDLANTLTVIRQNCLPFAIGALDCYFAFAVRDADLQLMNLYAAISLIERAARAKDGGTELSGALAACQLFMRDLQGGKASCPAWYKRARLPAGEGPTVQ